MAAARLQLNSMGSLGEEKQVFPMKKNAQNRSRLVGSASPLRSPAKLRYCLPRTRCDRAAASRATAAETAAAVNVVARRESGARATEVGTFVIRTKLLRLATPVRLGEAIDGWRVCWLGGWHRGRIFFVVMVERKSRR